MISVEEMVKLENEAGVSVLELMERAGTGAAEVIKEKYRCKGKRVLVIAGQGNNGGDGFVVARCLAEVCEVDILFVGDEDKLKTESKVNFDKVKEDYRIQFIPEEAMLDEYYMIIDAIFGTGIRGELRSKIASLIDLVNKTKARVVSLDVPSGTNPDTGEILYKSIEPELIITFHDIKKGLKKQKDKCVIVDIGL